MSDTDNVIDFIEFRMHSLIEQVAADGEYALASQMSEALDSYILGTKSIEFVDGWPLVTEIAEE